MRQCRCSVLLFAVLLGLFLVSTGREIKIKHGEHTSGDSNYVFNHTLAEVLVAYSSAVYTSDLSQLFFWTCERCGGKIKDFEMVELIVDIDNCLQAFVGVDHTLGSIIIAFRGTQDQSISNWIEDLFWKQLDLDYPNMPGAMVHHGFYTAYHNTTLRPAILSAVQSIKSMYGNISMIATGHSMGAALASFCALDLVDPGTVPAMSSNNMCERLLVDADYKSTHVGALLHFYTKTLVNNGENDVQLMTFGQPRIGNAVFATCFNEIIPKAIRLTHQHDIVPHMPPYYSYFPTRTYHHFSREVWLHEEGQDNKVVEKICDDSGEDPTCSRSVYGNSILDHLKYYGVELCSDADSECRIVMLEGTEEYNMGAGGNIRLSRNSNLTFLQSI